ncbi:DUF3606 domain-containing protein [Hymenobacter sp. 5317J-9]|uniref:CBS domain-containing protein n=1 Tax=Hymenobacter sp. 5317J-9 TaxID=2932250 RepID=UPI001FD63EC2|nr:CBS domain-containing protein [Hymenobacter sp. 5317J-9]UOQ99872.1 DUF3606 domain-containing protein [Hymenobacter sp. 5317J-9]
MPILAGQLIQEQKLVSVTSDESLTHALTLMIESDFSQLPVIDGDNKPLGVVTCASIAKSLLHLGAKVEDLRVNHALVKLPTYPEDEDLLYLLDTILKASAVFVVNANGRLSGIITEYDTTQYFRQRAEDLVLINDIEDALKRHLQIVYDAQEGESPTLRDAIDNLSNSLDGIRKKSHASLKALCKAQKTTISQEELDAIVDKHFPIRGEARTFADLSLAEFIQLAQKNWTKLEPVFNISQPAWSKMMEDIRLVRNKLFHFKGDTTPVERNSLQFCANWYANHPPLLLKNPESTSSAVESGQPNAQQEQPVSSGAKQAAEELPQAKHSALSMSKYEPLYALLAAHGEAPGRFEVNVNTPHLSEIIPGGLPKAAREHLNWWKGHPEIARELSLKGWRTIAVNPDWVVFQRIPTSNKPINFNEPWEVSYWCERLNCTRKELNEAVIKVGPRPIDVNNYLSIKEITLKQ